MNNHLDGDWGEFETIALVELAHEFDPVETKRVQETLHYVHDHQDAKRGSNENKEADEHEEDIIGLESRHQSTIVEDLGELGMG